MKKQKGKKSVFWQIVKSILFVVLSFFLGIFLDSQLFTGTDGVKGHGMPVFTMVLPMLAAAVIVIRLIVALIKYFIRKK